MIRNYSYITGVVRESGFRNKRLLRRLAGLTDIVKELTWGAGYIYGALKEAEYQRPQGIQLLHMCTRVLGSPKMLLEIVLRDLLNAFFKKVSQSYLQQPMRCCCAIAAYMYAEHPPEGWALRDPCNFYKNKILVIKVYVYFT